MEIINAFPPNIEEIKKRFNLDGHKPVFSYGKILYVPYGADIDPHLMAHEMTHGKYQIEMGVENWWKKYLYDDTFRLDQEVEAYRAQYKRYCHDVKDGNRRAKLLNFIADSLSSAMYGNLVSKSEAMRLIKQ